jgi:hypothetical protein
MVMRVVVVRVIVAGDVIVGNRAHDFSWIALVTSGRP